MPVDIQPLPPGSINIKWKDPYASASLNRRPVGITPPGIYRGLVLSVDPLSGDRTVNIDADPDKGDHVAVFENEDGFSVNYRDAASGDITISLTAYGGASVVVSIVIDYQIGVSTTGSFRLYTEAEFSGLSPSFRASLIVLGTISVPASGAISSAAISLNSRTLASQNIQRGTVQNAPVARNHLFEIGETGQSYARSSQFWDKISSVGSGSWVTSTDRADSGTKSIRLDIAAAPFTGEISQQAGIEVMAGGLLVCAVSVWQEIAVSSGIFEFFAEFSDSNGDPVTTVVQDLSGGVSADWRVITPIFRIPVGATALRSFGVRGSALDPLSLGSFAHIDSVEVMIEPFDAQFPYAFDERFRQRVGASSIHMMDEDGNFSDPSAHLSFDSSTPAGEGKVSISPTNPSDLPPALELAGRMVELGSQLLATGVNALKARISAGQADVGVSTYTLMWESQRAGVQGSRSYVKWDGTLVNTGNAYWDGSLWNKDVDGVAASRGDFGTDGSFILYVQAAGANTWADGAWTNTTFDLSSAGGIQGQLSVGTAAAPSTVFSLFAGGLKVGTAVIDPAAEELVVSGDLKVGDVHFRLDYDVAFPRLDFDGPSDSIGYHRANNQFQFAVGNQLRFTVDDDGTSSRMFRPSNTGDHIVSRFEVGTRNQICMSVKVDQLGVAQGRPWNLGVITNIGSGNWTITANETMADDALPIACCHTTGQGYNASAWYDDVNNWVEVRTDRSDDSAPGYLAAVVEFNLIVVGG